MNEHTQDIDDKNIDDRALDLLVDGELPEDQRRRLLTGLDGTTDGWRRCALAFLEAQAWRSHLPAIVKQADLRPAQVVSADVVEVRPRRAGPAWRVWRPRLALAASFLMAFSLGMALRSAWLSDRDAGPASSLATNNGAGAAQVVSASPTNPQFAAGDDGSQMRRLQLRTVGAEQPTEVQWPMYDTAAAPRGAANSQPAVPLEVIRELERQGHEVSQFRDWVPVQLEDGRQGLVPVDRVDVQMRNLNGYQ